VKKKTERFGLKVEIMTKKVWVVVDYNHADTNIFCGNLTKKQVKNKLFEACGCSKSEFNEMLGEYISIEKKTIKK
jgi:hypothetical protein